MDYETSLALLFFVVIIAWIIGEVTYYRSTK